MEKSEQVDEWKIFYGKLEIEETTSMKTAIALASELAEEGDVVLLSPACASFDRFKNYEHRGDCFKKAVNALAIKENTKV